MIRSRRRYYRYFVVHVHVQLIRSGDNIVLQVDVVTGDVLHINFLLGAGSRHVLSNSGCQHGFFVTLLVQPMP